uniref:non-specific serine/threonine protein kinase n=1 Tax=Salix viminalis TaxID=40686 RepID=A0A6N2KLI9_SALVM
MLDVEGELQYWKLDVDRNWSLQWMAPRDKCSVFNACGNFGSCNLHRMLACRCLPGFKPASPESWRNGDFSGGCSINSAVCEKNDTFSRLKMMRVGKQDYKFEVDGETKCREECLNNCPCQAYSFVKGEVNKRRDRQPSINMCLIWKDVLKDLQEANSDGGRDLSVRVAIADTVVDGKSGGTSRKKKPLSLIVGVTIASVIVLSSIFLYTCILMRKKAKRRESQQNTERNAALMYGTEKRVKNFIDAEELNEEDKKGIDAKSCKPCGINVIPYPLSTGSDCGDPMYSSFHCNTSTGKLSFNAQNGTYNVTTIDQDKRTFAIQDKDGDHCNSSTGGQMREFNLSLPFKMIDFKPWCDTVEGNFGSNISSQGLVEIVIGWEPPPEPVCTSSADCEDWPNSTCKNVTGNGKMRCQCNSNFRWDDMALNCVQDVDGHIGGSSRKKKPLSLIVGVTIASVIVLSSIFLYTCILMRKKAKRRESLQNTERNAALMYGTEKRVKNFIDAEELNEEDKKGIDVPFFDLDSILAATDYFSEENKLGRGGFGPVYKGKFPGGQEIAIKRLSSVSGQGLEEFKNEVILIARLQHRNLVRLVGYCIEGVEKILLYEYMPNKSLDSFIFDRAPGILLNWETRFDIILGVARGLLYLHQDSRLRIIHRDMKTSNILLDAEMNPKISDFGLARMFEGKQTEGSTNRVVGTYGYMAPEYALDGLFSVKSDVFSFGVVVIEILSGRRNGGYFNSDEAQSLLVYAWRIWREDKALDLMDETLHESCNTNEFLRCLNAALLCVQDDPADRPTMSNVVVMLSSEAANLPVPKEPAFFIRRGSSGTASTSSKQERGLSSTAFSSSKQETSIDTEVASDEDTITYPSVAIGVDRQESLVSAGKRFELGFFTPEESTISTIYLGIWYYKSNPRIVVWVANRAIPLPDDEAGLSIERDGNLKILHGDGTSYWSTELPSTSKSAYREAKLLDSGNLVFRDTNNTLVTTNLWESFAHPTDTFLPGMKMRENLKLISWESKADPKKGKFSFQLDERSDQFVIFNIDHTKHWVNGESGDFFSSERMPDKMTNFLLNTTGPVERFPLKTNRSAPYPKSRNSTLPPSDYNNTRIMLDVEGELQYWKLDKDKKWSLQWMAPGDKCSVSNACGNSGSCNLNNIFACRCLPGFKPQSPESWRNGSFSDGCIRSSDVCGKNITFLRLKMMRVGQEDNKYEVENETKCREDCLNNCLCQAYSFVRGEHNREREPINQCLIWTDVLKDLQEEYSDGVPDLFVRADTELKAKSCKPCGINVIPYPLSNGSDCGDPMYSGFDCDNSTGKLSFKIQNGTYNVTTIDQDIRTFVIQDEDVDYCTSSAGGQKREFNLSLPFKINSFKPRCDTVAGNFGSNISSQGLVEIVIGWEPPPEPVCTSSADCEDWPNSTCKNVTGNGKMRCQCNSNFRWDSMALKCVQVLYGQSGGFSRKKKPLSLIVGVTIASVIVLSSIFLYTCILMKKKAKRRESQQNTERNAALMYGTEKRVKNFIDAEELNEEDKKGIDVPFFDLDSILDATDYFSEENKLGRGGFGPVYKGKFPGGQEIAIKRLSSVSGQGLEEFKNEVILIARLQHRNLVRLVGYCIKGVEKILLYEYMPNKSLDSFIFDRAPGILLNWETRFDIILGVARGLLYLHQDSRLRIIHRDMKTSNILLDAEMNPKISDFGLARMFEGKQTEGSTNRVVGTYGYMAPEYALDGLFSVKSDVFSFGVVVIEILSGKRNGGYFNSDEAQSLLVYAWRIWREDKALDLMDKTLHESCNTNEFLRCLNAALLCVQDDPADRPTMSNVVLMLSSEIANLPVPKEPAFSIRRGFSGIASTSSKQERGLSGTTFSSSKQETSIDTEVASDEASVKRKCKICGTTIIPYPLSTGPNCGDKMYYSFLCDDSSGQLSFEMPDGKNYNVTGIDEELQKFSIRVGDDDCKANESMGYSTESWPFNVIGRCDANLSKSRLGSSFEDTGFSEVEIRWTAPSEPLCSSLDECNDWPHSTCSSATDGKKRCLCIKSFRWDPKTVDCIPASKKKRGSLFLVLLGVIGASVIIPCASFLLCYLGKSKKGMFPGGQEIAIKRLSSGSGQGMEEFKNEIILIAKLQHRNLVRLLGYCVQGCEKIGYMAPEYAMDGVFSMKSDVFSFGVVVLEILSGKRNKEFYKSDKGFSLSAYAWRLWKEEKVLDLMDRALCETCDANEFVRRGLNQRDLRAMLSAVFFSYAFFLCCFARDTITYTSGSIRYDRQETLVSAGKRFELGFFTPEESTDSRRHLGIWYYKSNPRIVVWVANRTIPLPDDEAGLAIAKDGNLKILHGDGTSYWSTELPSTSKPAYREAKLLDSGNLVFRDTNNTLVTTNLWESFAHPTDTFLPGMKMRENLKLISWESKADPKEGNFSFQLDKGRNQFVIFNDHTEHWVNGESSDFFSSERMPDGMTNFLSNTTGSDNNTMIRLDVEGELQLYWNFDVDTDWSLQWMAPIDKCSVSNACGNFGSCNLYNMLACRCLPGFKPTSPESWRNGDFSGGCSRSSDVCGKNDTFLSLKMKRVGQEDKKIAAENETICREMCLNNCSCQAYSFVNRGVNMRRDGIKNLCLIWTYVLKDLQEDYSYGGRDLFVRVAIADTVVDGQSGGSSRKKKPLSLIVGVTIASVIVLSSIFLYTCILMRKKAKRRDAEELNEEDKKGIDVPFFDLDSILAATDYFSEENKLGRGGFGPVYKGKFPGGQEIAIKRLSSVSGQGLEEFKNEVILIARLQHRNLVRLVGYCIKGVEKILLYEYMPNKSLDSFIFDRAPGILLNWETRFDIILGVARGLLYLHQDSRLRIIHRDMKTSNILLDAEMNPKISDFGLARMFEGKQTEGSTNRVVGTYGYMAPEYAMDGVFSMKSDVFSFGVVVLEILSGKRNKEFYKSDKGFSLSAHAWRLWKEEKVLDLMDRALSETCDANEFVRCVNVGLLCVQEHPWDRPTMSTVALMLGSDTASLPTPNKPAFSASRSLFDTASSSSQADSYVELTNTLEQGR